LTSDPTSTIGVIIPSITDGLAAGVYTVTIGLRFVGELNFPSTDVVKVTVTGCTPTFLTPPLVITGL
jgi:hypothetical protein